jgi:hypothetical protein
MSSREERMAKNEAASREINEEIEDAYQASHPPTERGREVDVHPVRFDDQGNGHLLSADGEPFGHSSEAFAATGSVFRTSGRVPVRRSADVEPFMGI